MTNHSTGQACYVVVAFDATGLPLTTIYNLEAAGITLALNEPPCPAPAAGAPAPTVSPAQLAEQFWYIIHLPVPAPTSHPDFATTGKPTYLQTGDTNTPPSWTRPTPLGTLRITAHGTYTINWGDTTPTSGPYLNPGGRYPNGTITHTYDSTGTVTITVREDWTATWSIGTAHGTLTHLHTTGTLPNFPIGQIQAVITS